jgi:hypothetical protein
MADIAPLQPTYPCCIPALGDSKGAGRVSRRKSNILTAFDSKKWAFLFLMGNTETKGILYLNNGFGTTRI